MKLRFLQFLFLLQLLSARLSAQDCSNMNITWQADIASTCKQMVMTMAHDANGKPYLYVANKEAGLKIYNISDPSNPVLKKTISTAAFDSLDLMSLHQQGSYLYLAVGNHFNDLQSSGLAIVKVDTPDNAWVTSHWKLPSSKGGAGVVHAEGNYAYLGCMGNGLAILDIGNKYQIVQKSLIRPDINYPTASPNPALYNARGMAVKNQIVYLCYDAGGIRIVNATDPSKPRETSHFSNPVLNGKSRAYNNCILDDSLLYVGVDYCGLEVLNVKDTHNITLHGTWNPYGCPNSNWFTSPVHVNEIQLNKACQKLFVADGKSDMHVLDVSDPAHPDSCSIYGGAGNNLGTWGVGIWDNQIYLSYVCSIIPFSSNWTGVKILTWTPCANHAETTSRADFRMYPNPVHGLCQIETGTTENVLLDVWNASGKLVCSKQFKNSIQLETGTWAPGLYVVTLRSASGISSSRLLICSEE